MTQKSELTEVAEQESLTRPKAKEPPRLLIEEWLPAAAIGVECMRERSTAPANRPTSGCTCGGPGGH
jgi:hypothetical protein